MLAQAWAQNSPRATVTTERVRAELMAHAPDGVGPGKTVWVGLQLAHQPEWHTYWKNSGDSGLPTQLEWTLPAGVLAGDIAWPVPRKIPLGNLANYGYEGTVLLPVPLAIAPDFKPGPLASALDIRLKASWLVCKKECIPEDGEFALQLPLNSTTALHGAAFQASFEAQPQPLPAGSTVRIDGDTLRFAVAGLPAALQGRQLEFFPETGEVIQTAGAWTQAWQGATWTAAVPLSPQRSQSPAAMPVVLAHGGQGWRAEVQVQDRWPATAAPAAVPPALQAALRDNAALSAAAPTPASSLTLGAALLGALLGGLILNLMPCVFPVLAIKVVGFAQHGGEQRRLGGLAYTAGVVLSFLALGAAMLALRAAGEQLGWGFQLQSPAVVAALAALFTLIGLNLAGVFEFGSFLPSRLATLQSRHPAGDAFLSGVLAVAIASPCTAPFMGASLGLAVALPPAQALAVFAALGVGMALPYLAASWLPALARRLPRPGPWMDTFRRLMAFPMFATVAWLVWVLGQQSGIDGAGALLGLLVALSFIVWTLGLRGRARTALAAVSLAAFALLAWAAGPNVIQAAPAAGAVAGAAGERWQPWSPARVDELLAAGQPVFVDFTAAWCVTCQYNKKTTLAREDVLADFSAKNVALLRADWTRRDAAITAALARLGRSGVPVYVVYKKGSPPVVLSEVLGVEEVRSVIANL
ncbi:protein-disulfide reductase DsbD family protein [Ramlibacter tataouinensis]|uniref:Thiol:disulfide reductase (Thiol:disulfide interchange protein)-like protein n=1 Tax=Ramlibacter tataouinensis (strain ATCC BAA-407 / DSM 14655 / LMG 21543 / TTB310) TaxID=365046 RepID=F5XVK8_RAMTT|nr:thiol:disulfide reductase (thiol:disulfide interchange protein)-like protein [Ramlibacter tataouinensis TTB310]